MALMSFCWRRPPAAALLGVAAVGSRCASATLTSTPRVPNGVTHTAWMDIAVGVGEPQRVVFGLYGSTVPCTAMNFFKLCQGYRLPDSDNSGGGEVLTYAGSSFHRVIPEFMAQGGDITAHDGTGGRSIFRNATKFRDENFSVRHAKGGLLSMANSGKHTNSSQFFITFRPTPWLDGHHVVFGEVLEGRETLVALEARGTASGRPSAAIRILKSGVLIDPRVAHKRDFSQEDLQLCEAKATLRD